MKAVIDFFRDLFGWQPPSPPGPLRNKPGGLAFIKGVPEGFGAEVLNGRVVRTVRFVDGNWEVDPVQRFTLTADVIYTGWPWRFYRKGRTGMVGFIEDHRLEPMKDAGLSEEEVTELFNPAPARTTESA